MIRVACPTCGSQFDTHEQYAGQVANCTNCQTPIQIPAATPPPGQPAAMAPPGQPAAVTTQVVVQAPAGKPGKVTAIAVMTLVGGIFALISALIWFVYGVIFGLATCGILCILFVPATYSLALGIVAIIFGCLLLAAKPKRRSAPYASAIMQVVNIISLDLINVILGIVVLIFLSDRKVRAFFR